MPTKNSILQRISTDSYFRMGFMHQEAGEFEAAAECYMRSIQNEPSPQAHTFLGRVLNQLGEIDVAIDECKRAIELDPDFGNALSDLGTYFAEKKQLDLAVDYLKRACKAKDFEAPEQAHYQLAKVYIKKELMVLAQKETIKSLKKNPKYEPALTLKGQLDHQIH